MVEIEDLQVVNQLIDNMIVLSGKLEETYGGNDSQGFGRVKAEILDIQKKIEEMIK
jgi:CRISPR/Cas system CSM-associated protein Csm3 (group 7 of RAMP superfamily)|tara:strand:- start:89 stop:256 length:168 start_codon:yes stop_codon:yes gene_type:complete